MHISSRKNQVQVGEVPRSIPRQFVTKRCESERRKRLLRKRRSPQGGHFARTAFNIHLLKTAELTLSFQLQNTTGVDC